MAFLTIGGQLVQMPGAGGAATAVVMPDPEPPVEYTGLCFTAQAANSTVELTRRGELDISDTAYSRDGSTWTAFTPSETAGTNVITLSNIGDKVYFKNTINFEFDYGDYLQFKMSGSISASGNCNSMYNAVGFESLTTLDKRYCFCYLFSGCKALTTAPELPATGLAENCYEYMFAGCENLTSAPVLPAMDIPDCGYVRMFATCTSLVTPPALPATSLMDNCYSGMFLGCTSLTTAPVLPATSLAPYCYYEMFANCTSLNYIEVAFSDWSEYEYTESWVTSIGSSGNFVCPENLAHTRGDSSIPYGWTINGTCSTDCLEDECFCDDGCDDEDSCDENCFCDDGCDDEDSCEDDE